MRSICLIASFFILSWCRAQSFNYHAYTVEDGLPSSQTYDVLQDKNKFIWIASDKGVSRFDGYTFTNYTQADGLPYAPVYRLFEDRFGRIWFLSLNGKLSYYVNEKIVPYRYNESMAALSIRTHDVICAFQVKKDSSIIVGTVFSGAFKISAGGKIQDLTMNDNRSADYCVLQENGNNTYCYSRKNETPGKQLSELNVFNGAALKFSMRSTFANNKNLFFLVRKNGHVLFASNGELLDYYKGQTWVSPNSPNVVISLYEDSDSCLWVGYYQGGVKKFSPNKNFLDPGGRLYFPQKQITKVMEDYEQGFWFTTLHDGLLYAPSVNIENFVFKNDVHSEEKAVALEGDSRSRVFVGTNQSAVYVFSGGMQTGVIYAGNRNGRGIIKLLYYAAASRQLYMGTYSSMSRMEKNGSFTPLKSMALSICADSKGILYAGFYRNVISHYPENHEMDIINPSEFMRSDAVCFDDQNTLWIGSPNGLYFAHNGQALKYAAPNNTNRISCLTRMKNKLYAGTIDGGLLEVDPLAKTPVLTRHAIGECSIYDLDPLNDSEVFVSSSSGAFLYNVKTRESSFRLTRSNGLPSTEVRQMLCLNDTIYTLTNEGVSYFRMEHFRKNIVPPKVQILGCTIDSVNYIHEKKPAFDYRENYIAFNFVGLSYRSLGKVQYRYRLLGYKSDWERVNTNRVQFPFLPAGDYVFEVVAINEDGVESSSSASFAFTILLPFWKTAWFIALCAVLVLGLFFLVFFVRYRRLKEKNEMLQQINDLRQKAMTLQMNPHFVFNALNSIQSFVLTEDSYKATKYLSRFAKLIRMGLHHSNVNMVSLDEEITLLNLYLELEQMRFKNKFDFRLDVAEEVSPKEISIPPMLVQPLVENAIKHGVDLKKSNNLVSVAFYKEKDQLMCRIEDNGKGINAALKTKAPSTDEHQSMGMHITTQRIRLFCEKEGQAFVFEVTDKSDIDRQNSGTVIVFSIPFSKE